MPRLTLSLGRWILLAVLAVLAASDSLGSVIQVPAGQPTIQAGLDAAAYGDTVLVAPGIYYEHDVLLRDGVHLIGESARSGAVTIDAQGLGRVLIAQSLHGSTSIQGLTLTNGDAGDLKGGALFCSASCPVVRDCEMRNSRAERGGAVISRDGSSSVFIDCVFESNECDVWGGGLYFLGGSGTMDGCLVAGNRCDTGILIAEGGGVYASDCELELTGCSFARNEARYGGGVYITSSEGVVGNCTFRENTATNSAGALYISWSSPPVSDCCFVGNSAGYRAGAAEFNGYSGSASRFTRCVFEDNTADFEGAVLAMGTTDAEFVDCAFVRNSSADNVGAVSLGGGNWGFDGENAFIRCEFSENSTRLDAGALSLGKYRTLLVDCTFDSNAAGRDAAAVRCHGNAVAEFVNCTLYGNSAVGNGAAILAQNYAQVLISRSIMAFCSGEHTVHRRDSATVTAECCDAYGNPTGTDWTSGLAGQLGTAHNMCADPLFCLDLNPGEPLTLRASTPCIMPDCGAPKPIGARSVGCEVTTVEPASWGAIKARYR